MYMLENNPLPPFDKTIDYSQDGVCQPLAVDHGDDFVSLEQRDGTNEFDHCVLVRRALVPQLIAYLQRVIVEGSGQITTPPHQQRVVAEKEVLDGNLAKLTAFISSEKFHTIVPSEAEQKRLTWQREIMNDYSIILAERIAAFAE